MRVAILGGGPAGLYLAYLLRKRGLASEVIVYERNPADATWGFGIGLPHKVLEQLERVDEASFRAVSAELHWVARQSFVVDGDAVPIDRVDATGAISRLRLLRILQQLCAGVGVTMHFGRNVPPEGIALLGAELVVGADGANSTLRRVFARQFGVERTTLSNRFAWYGVGKAFATSSLNFKTLPDSHAAFVAHSYPYAADMSTFIMECDEYTWFALGLDVLSDEERREATQRYYAEELGCSPLISNNSIWRRFSAIWVRNWHFGGRYVLLGDALRVAHPSIGSGTRLAIEDAIALAEAVQAHPASVPQALESFVAARRPAREALASAAERSFGWYEDFRTHIAGRRAIDVAHSFLMRTGMLNEERLRKYYPQFVAAYEQRSKTNS